MQQYAEGATNRTTPQRCLTATQRRVCIPNSQSNKANLQDVSQSVWAEGWAWIINKLVSTP